MPSRRTIRTDNDIISALYKAKTKNDTLSSGTAILNPATVARLEALYPDFQAKLLARGIALSHQGGSTSALNALRDKARTYISHFIQTFNNGIVREVFSAPDRAFYMLNVNSSAVPDLSNEHKILFWGDNIQSGDIARTSNGGAPMGFPTIEEFNTVFNAYKTAYSAHSTLKDNYDDAQQAVQDLRPAADDLVLRIWNEVETYYSSETPSSKRRKCREWGVVYTNDVNENAMTGIVTDSNNNPVEGAVIEIEELLITATSHTNGEYIFPVIPDGTYNIKVTKPNFHDKHIPNITITAGITTNLNIQIISTIGSMIAVVTYKGQPLDGANISIDPLELSVSTGSDGIGELDCISPGTYVITISKPNFQTQTISGITINAGGSTNVTVDLVQTTGTLIANVYSQGKPLGGSTVRIDSLGLQTITTPDGIGHIIGIKPGSYSITASAPDKVTVTHTIEIHSNQTASVTFDLPNVSG